MNRCFWCGTQCSARFCSVECQTAALEMPDLVARPEDLPEVRRLSAPKRSWLLGGLVFLLGAATALLLCWSYCAGKVMDQTSPCQKRVVKATPPAATLVAPAPQPRVTIRFHREVRVEPRPLLFSAPAVLRYEYEMRRGVEPRYPEFQPPLPVIRQPFYGSFQVRDAEGGSIKSFYIRTVTPQDLR